MMRRQNSGTQSSTGTGHTGRYLKDADEYTLPQNVLYFSVCLIGSGFIVLPYTTVVLSLPVVIGCLILLGATSCYTNKMIIEMAEDYHLNALEDIGEKSFGLVGYYVTWLSAFGFSFTSALVCLAAAAELIGRVIGRNVQFSWNLEAHSVSRVFVVLAVASPSLLVSIIRVPRKIVVFHFFALCAAVSTGCVLLAMLVSQIDTGNMRSHWSCWMPPKSVNAEYVECMMLLAFCFVGHHKSLDAFQHLRLRDESGRWSRVVRTSSYVVFAVYCIGACTSMICSQGEGKADFCSNVKEHAVFEFFLAVTLSLIVPSDISTMRRLTVRMLTRHNIRFTKSLNNTREIGGNGGLVVFSSHGVPTLQGMALGGQHFTPSLHNSSQTEESLGDESSRESLVGGSSGSESSRESPLKPPVRRVTISETPHEFPSLNNRLLDEEEEEEEEGAAGDVEGGGGLVVSDRETASPVSYQPPLVSETITDITTQDEEESDEKQSFIPQEIIEEERESSVRDSTEIRDSETNTRDSDVSDVGSDVGTAKRRHSTLAKFRKGVAKKTGAHGFFSRTSPTSPASPAASDDDGKYEAVSVSDNQADSEIVGSEVDSEIVEVGEIASTDNEDTPPIAQSQAWTPDSLLPPHSLAAPTTPLKLNQSWPRRLRGHSQPEVMTVTTGLGSGLDRGSGALHVVNRAGRSEVGAWAFSTRHANNTNTLHGGGGVTIGQYMDSEEMKHDHYDASEWMSVVSDDDGDPQLCDLFSFTSIDHIPPTFFIWLITVFAVWTTNFPPAVVLMTYVGGFGASLLALVLPAAFYFKLQPLSSDFSAIARFGAVRNQTLMLLVLAFGVFFLVAKSSLIIVCTSLDSDWCFEKKDVSLIGRGNKECFHS